MRDGPTVARPTMRDVARVADVSLKTVSRVVNGEPVVDPGTSARVQAAIASLGYRRNDLARRLRGGHASSALGLVIGSVANPYYASVSQAVEEHARSRGYLLITGSTDDDPARERELVEILCERRVDGLLVVAAAGDHGYLAAEVERGLAVVFLDRPPVGIVADAVVPANRDGARTGVAHLLAHGHRRVAHVGPGRDVPYVTGERLAGYRDAHRAAGVPVDETLVLPEPASRGEAAAAVRALLALPDPPTAVFTANNRCTVGACAALRDEGVRLALVGFDDFELADLLDPPVTVVTHDPAELGRRGARFLLDRLDGDRRPASTVLLETRLIRRGSGELSPRADRAAVR